MYLMQQNPKTGFYTKLRMDSGYEVNLMYVHKPAACRSRGCAIHNHPSEHPLMFAPMVWRDDLKVVERLCVHGIGHVDADVAAYLKSIGEGSAALHTCDGCC